MLVMAYINNLRAVKRYKRRVETSPNDFKYLFRFNEANVHWLANHFFGEENETRGGALSSFQKMKVFLLYVADPGYQNSVGEIIGIHQSTVSKTVAEVIEKIWQKANLWIKFPSSNEEIREAQRLWQQIHTFPAAVGVLDCTHVHIRKPSQFGDEYINRKGFASINVQATCDAQDKFTSVDVQWPGSTHDSRIWKRSDICAVMRRNTERALLLADEGYGIEPCLMTPYRIPNTPQETRYNNLLKKERVCIERCFGQLKQRFSILQYKTRVKLTNIPKLIVCCIILHNIAKTLGEPDFELQEEMQLNNDANNPIEENENDDINIRRSGMRRREEIAHLIFQQNL